MLKRLLVIITLAMPSIVFSAQNYILDPSFNDFRLNTGESEVWISHEDSKAGLGDVGSSSTNASGKDPASAFRFKKDGIGSARIRFKKSEHNNDLSTNPGLSQIVIDLPKNKDMTYSLYYCDKEGATSPASLYMGVRDINPGESTLSGNLIAAKLVHILELRNAPKAKDSCFHRVSVDFNSGERGIVEVFALLAIDNRKIDGANMKKDIEIRVDDFSVRANK
ncbi:hypothetical protein ACR30L_18205 [Psychromonas sp. PT13]|uniref:hypothetical protein n=1 Tax=Psychromonas sp. PT13 TaxID=3439547 RepID=UPI003EB750C2